MRAWFLALTCALLAVFLASRARGDTQSTPETTGEVPPPQPKGHEPFTPYDTGPPEAQTPYEDLTPDEQAQTDLGRDTAAWEGVHDAYAAAAADLANRATAERATHQLGAEALGTTGVIP